MNSYQTTIEDVERNNQLALQPGRIAYIDECGNFGFNFAESGTSTHYIICAVVVNNEKNAEIESKAEDIRRQNFGHGEMKSSSIGNKHQRRAKILSELMVLDFSLIILIADKQSFYAESPLREYKEAFVKFLHQKLYEAMYSVFPKLKIVEDEYGSSEFQLGYKKYVIGHRPAQNLLDEYDFDYIDSRRSGIVQIADIFAGSVMYHIKDSTAPDAIKIFQGKIRDVIEFPRNYPSYTAGVVQDKEFDQQIYHLADRCAMQYIENNKDSDEEEIRLRILFLRHLLFTVRNVSDTKFIFSTELTRTLSSLSEKKVNRDYLYRKIVAPLRDANVLIASSAHGYKIPTCVGDVVTYINQTNGIVSPMLNRIEKCRNLIRKQTDGNLDILNDPALEKLKRYFGDY